MFNFIIMLNQTLHSLPLQIHSYPLFSLWPNKKTRSSLSLFAQAHGEGVSINSKSKGHGRDKKKKGVYEGIKKDVIEGAFK